MGDREVDQQLVERAQRGDKRAFELLVLKYQRKLGRLLSRFVRDSAEVEDVTQEAFIKAYRALPSFRGESAFYTWLYRIGINTAKNYLVALGPAGADDDRLRQRGGGRLRGCRAAAGLEHAGIRARGQGDRGHGEPRDGRAAGRPAHGDHAAGDRGLELRGNCQRHELSRRHGALADLPRARRDRRGVAAAAGNGKGSEMVMREQISRLMDGDLEGAEADAVVPGAQEHRRPRILGVLPRHRRRAAPQRRADRRLCRALRRDGSTPSRRCLRPKPRRRTGRGCRSPGPPPRRSRRWSSSARSRSACSIRSRWPLRRRAKPTSCAPPSRGRAAPVAGLSHRAPGIFADHADPGRRALPARGGGGRRRWPPVAICHRPHRNDGDSEPPRSPRPRMVPGRARSSR